MFGFLKLAAVVAAPTACEAEAEVFLNRYTPQDIITNKFVSNNHRYGTRDYDAAPWFRQQDYHSVPEGTQDSWMAHLKRTLPPGMFDTWMLDMEWRHDCWDMLDNYVNYWRYGGSFNTNRSRIVSLTRLKKLLGPDAWAYGQMPPPIPTYTPEMIGWLQDLWTERTGFQGRKNTRDGINPLRVDVPIKGYAD
jgi:hypothetical protein